MSRWKAARALIGSLGCKDTSTPRAPGASGASGASGTYYGTETSQGAAPGNDGNCRCPSRSFHRSAIAVHSLRYAEVPHLASPRLLLQRASRAVCSCSSYTVQCSNTPRPVDTLLYSTICALYILWAKSFSLSVSQLRHLESSGGGNEIWQQPCLPFRG